MLRSSSGLVPRRMSVSRIAACGALLLIGIMASGLRSPFAGNGQNLAAQEEGASASTLREQPKDFDLNLIPNDTAAIVSWRPSQVVVSPALAPAVSDMVKRLETDTGLNLTHVTQMTWVAHRDAERGGRGTLGLLSKPGIACILQSSDPKKLNDFIARVLPAAQAIQIGPFTIHRSDNESQPYAYYRPDEHTVVFDHIDTIARFLVGERGTPKLTSSSLWQAIAADPIVAIADVAWLSERLSLQPGEAPPAAAGPLAMQLVPFAPLYRDTQVAAASLSLNEATQLKLLATSTSEERAIRVQRTADAGLVLLGNYLEQAHHQTSKLPAEQLVVAHSVLSLAQRALASAKVQREGATVELTSSLPLEQAILLGLIAPALEAQRTAAQQASAMNNLKQIGIALHKYADAHGSFPPPVLIGPDGKTKYSWRVAILPYLDQASLYQQYDFGQEWDSPKNRSVLEQMPATFRSLSASPETQETSFVALVAPGAIFNDSGKGTPFAEIHDGTSNTLLIAACQLAVPWTKPEDLHIDMEYPPKLEAHDGMTFPALFADGSVKRLSRHLPQAVVRALITARGNEVIPLSPTQNK